MNKIFTAILCAFVWTLPFSKAQTVSLGADTTLPCGVSCLNIAANLSNIFNTTSYTIDSTSVAFASHFSFTGGSTASIPTIDDKFSGTISLPFNFCFYGQVYSSLVIGTNGILSFNTGLATGTCNYTVPGGIPSNTYHVPSILGPYHDVDPSKGGSINYYTTGTAPNRKFVVNYYQIPHYGTSCNVYTSTFQIVLYETYNYVELYIQDKPSCTGSLTNGLAIAGIQNSSTQALSLPGKNATVWGTTGMNKAYRFAPAGFPTIQLLNGSGTVIATTTPVLSGSQLTATFNNICTSTDSAKYIAKATFAVCPGSQIAYDTIMVKKFKAPTPGVTSPVSYCQGATSTPLTANGQSILWYTSSSSTTGSSTAPTPNTATPGTQVFYVTQTISGCESQKDSIVVNIIGTTAPIVTSNSPVCEGDTVKLFASTVSGVTYTWSGPNGFTSAMQNPIIIPAAINASGTYSVYTSANNCNSPVAQTSVVINALPVINNVTGSDPTTCGGNNGSITINGLNSGTTYTINYTKNGVPQTAIVQTATSGSVIISNLSAGNYNNITVNANGCNAIPAGPVILNNPTAPAAPTLGSNSPLCAGATLNLTSNAISGATYTWSGPNSFTSGQQNPSIPNIQQVNAGVYTLTATVNNCTSAPGVVTVVVNAIPVAPTASSNTPICAGATLNLAATINAGATYTWSGPNGFTSTQQNPSINNATIAASGVYTVTTTVNNCTSSQATTTVVINAIPAAPVISSNSPVCEGSPINLSAGTVSGTTYSWSGPNSFTSAQQNPVITNAQSVNAGSYSVTATASNCVSPAATVAVVVNPNPSILAVNFSNPTTCNGNDGYITLIGGIANNSYTVNYLKNSIAQTPLNIVANSSGNIVVNNLSAGAYSNFTITLNGCVSAPYGSVTLTDPLPPVAPAISSNSPVCVGGTIDLIAANVPGATYTWSGPNGFTSTQLTPSIPNAQTNNSGVYSLTVTSNNCTSSPVTTTVSVQSIPSAPSVTSNSPVCQGSTLSLMATSVSGATYTWSGPNGFTSSAQNPAISNLQSAQVGNYTVTVSIGTCTSAPSSVTVSMLPTPDVTSTNVNNPTTCGAINGSILLNGLNANTAYNIVYTRNSVVQPTVNTTSSGTGTVTLSGLSAGSYTNIIVTLNSCADTVAGPLLLTDPGSPATPTASNNGPVCPGGSIILNANTSLSGVSYTWTGPNGYTSTQQNPTLTNVQAANAGVYSVTITQNNCVSAPATTTVTLLPVPSAPVLTSNSPVCDGGTIQLNATSGSGSSFSWTGPNSFNASIANPTITLATTANTGVYAVTATINGCSSPTSTITVTVNPLPSAPAISNIIYCQFATASALSATGQNLFWYTQPTGGTGTTIPPVPSTAVPGTFTWYVSQTVTGCEGQRSAITVTVTAKPQPPLASTTAITYCQGEVSVPLSVSGQNIQWYTQATGGTSNTIAPTPSTAIPGIFNWYASQTVNGCESDRVTLTVTVIAKPDTPVVNNPILYCEGEPAVPLSATGQNLLWYNVPSGGTGNATAPTPSTNAPGTTYYYVSQTVNGCTSNRATVKVVVGAKAIAGVHASRQNICQFDTAFIFNTISNPPTATYNWSFDGGTVVSGNGAGPYIIKWNTAGIKNVQLIINNGNCADTAIVAVTVTPSPIAGFDIKHDACIGEEIQTQAWNIVSGQQYNWNFDGATIVSGAGPGLYKLIWNTPGVKTISLQIDGGSCQSELFKDTIHIHENPDAEIAAVSNTDVCTKDIVTLSAKDDNNAYQYAWSPEKFFETNGQKEEHATIMQGGYIVLTVKDIFGCIGSDSLLIKTHPCCNVSVPDAFSPNRDGKNDIFRIVTIGHQEVLIFRIVNRWGQVIFQSNSQQNGWDGTFNGVDQELGTYHYYIKYKCEGETFEKKGPVTLIR